MRRNPTGPKTDPSRFLPDYTPKHLTRGVVFLHVPKTAGSFLNQLFAQAFGADACDPFLQGGLRAARRGAAVPRADYLSGHIRFQSFTKAALQDRYDAITILRDPMDRLVSHLNWADRFNQGVDRVQFYRLSRDEKQFVKLLRATDPQDPKSMRRLFQLDSITKAAWLFNPQMGSLFVTRHWNILDYTDMQRLGPSQIEAQVSRLGACTTLPQFLEGLRGQGVQVPDLPPVNVTASGRFSRTPLLKRCAERYVDLDAVLVSRAQETVPDLRPIAAAFHEAADRLTKG